ncbi:MAG: hypothetical protein Q8M76_00205, partial [Spirochaetaceae bacterium]|nr:hypothetical protein [Spirochaetaceae bacterium]
IVERFEPSAAEARLMRLLLPVSRRSDDARDELSRGAREAAAALRARAELASRVLSASSPEAVMARGFSVARRADGTAVRDASVLAVGEELALQFARGKARAGVREVSP